jgi:hypothetical protein
LKNNSHKSKIRLAKLAASAGIYVGFAICLYQPHLKKSAPLKYLVAVNVCLAALGCFALSRRWVSSFVGSLFAGAIYGFGPLGLWLSGFHPSVGLLAASIPWLLFPAALCSKRKWWWISAPLSALPFLVILLAFQVACRYHLFPIPIHTRLHLADLAGLLAPLVAAERTMPLVGFYHVSIATLFLLAAGVILAFLGPFFNISPILWLTIPVLCCSVVIGAGMQGFALAGFADRKWLLLTTAIMASFAITAMFLATKYDNSFAGFGTKYARLLMQTAKLYLLGAIATGIIFFMARAKLRLASLRLIVLSLAMAVDMLLCASTITYRIL